MTFRAWRILALMIALAAAAGLTLADRLLAADWSRPLEVDIYPLRADDSEQVADYVRNLRPDQFEEIGAFLSREAQRYGKAIPARPVITLKSEVTRLPPASPGPGASTPQIILWSLQLRYWAYRQSDAYLPELGKVRLFVLYHKGTDDVPLEHSLGLQKGLIGVVHAFARPQQNAQNNVVIMHELLHTLGATDKYDSTGFPLFPIGYADPERQPRHPQEHAEIMAGRLPLGEGRAVIPKGLNDCAVGYHTAYELGW